MSEINKLFNQPLQVLNLGTTHFYHELKTQGARVAHVDWQPPARGDARLLAALDILTGRPEVQSANEEAFARMMASRPMLTDMGLAGQVIPGMGERTLLHAGPPLTWDRMSGPMRGAVIGAILYEGWAKEPQAAETLASSGQISFRPCHEHQAVGPMAGLISPSMPVFIIENPVYGNRAYCTINEGLGKVLRYGAYSPEVLERLRWMAEVLAPALALGIRASGGIDLKALIAQSLHMGDECHNRNKAGTSLFIRTIAPHLVRAGVTGDALAGALEFMDRNDHFFLNLSMPFCKAVTDAAHGIANCTLVTAMCRNGTDFGIRVSGLPDRWFTAPAEKIKGLYFPGYSEEDANPDIGDSAITETAGIGGFAMAGAAAIVKFVGGTVSDAFRYTNSMYEITWGENLGFNIPYLNFRGTPTGIDITKVVNTGLLPIINTGIAHREPGVGQVGAGLVHPPRRCFEEALLALAAQIKEDNKC
ncbi:MAG: DUF1116 domain-containing protein [Bacillota bacterium]